MNQREYYDSALKYFDSEMQHETKVIKDLNKLLKKAKQEGWEPLVSLEQIISEWKAKRDYLGSAKQVVEEALAKKKSTV